MWLYSRIALVILLVILAIAAGLWLGEKSVPVPEALTVQEQENVQEQTAAVEVPGHIVPPVFFFPNVAEGTDWNVAHEEIRMAAAAGVHQYVIPVPLPWPGLGPEVSVARRRLEAIVALDVNARFNLYVRMDPSKEWLTAHPDDAVTMGEEVLPYAAIAAEAWRKEACEGLEALIRGLLASDVGSRIRGCVLMGLDNGRWSLPEKAAYDTSAANVAGFRRWLKERYGNDATLAENWGDAQAALATAAIPAIPDRNNKESVFFPLPAMQSAVDYLHYLSDETADALAELAWHVKDASEGGLRVVVPYGHSLELEQSGAGHYSLMRIVESDIDGFASPVSYLDRGFGGVGGPMGPLDSVALHGKQWYLVDDTRTGILRDPGTGEIARIKGLQIEDVFRVQERNFAAALTGGQGLVWLDPEGQGQLLDRDLWSRLGNMQAAYEEQVNLTPNDNKGPLWPQGTQSVAVVVDEASRFYQQCAAPLNRFVLTQARDAILRAGVPVKFYLLQDVLEERVPETAAYIFLNAFTLGVTEREKLHHILATQKASAVWLYAPGYVETGKADVAHVSATTRMSVKAFEGPALSGSAYQLDGPWVKKEEAFGESVSWAPLFYIEDEEADVIANYRDSGKASAAITFLEEGWASILFAEPALTPGVLRELLHILGMRTYFGLTTTPYFDATYFGPYLLGIHAKKTGERHIELGVDQYWNIQDLLAPAIGWQKKRSFRLPMRAGDTRILKLTPTEGVPPEQPF